jgi:O-methyltransferase involved in polyketide biosynthesis
MDGVNKTLYIPLYGKAYVSKKDLFIKDVKAEEIWAMEQFPLRGKAKSKWLAYYMGIRCAVFDDWLREKATRNKEAVVLHLGCGMDSRVLRVNNIQNLWYDVDFPDVIRERKRYFAEDFRYRMLGYDLRDTAWPEQIPETDHAIVVMEGVSMYLTAAELQEMLAAVCARFARVSLLMDCYTDLAVKFSAKRNPVKDVGVTAVYSLDDPNSLKVKNLALVSEREMTPKKYVQELQDVEQFLFRKLYAGGLSKKLYRLYEYAKG